MAAPNPPGPPRFFLFQWSVALPEQPAPIQITFTVAARAAAIFIIMLSPLTSRAEDGSRLWLRYADRSDTAAAIRQVIVSGQSPTRDVIQQELTLALEALNGKPPTFADALSSDGALIIGTPASSPAIAALNLRRELEPLGREGFIIRSMQIDGRRAAVIASQSDIGALYGTFHFLRVLQTGGVTEKLDITQRPRVQLRLLNHWDNLDGSIERGYAGRSLWKWDELPAKLKPRYIAYARANASIGINGSVLNNVNAKPLSLSRAYLEKAAALANVWRPYGIRVYLSANFSAPKTLGNLPTADPLDPQVATWWKAKADEIYQLIPDFGGFVVKANSEGQPGPQEYHRTHADGANVLADALAGRGGGGIVMWRTFVYDQDVDADRVKRAYKEFVPLDGKFRANVIVQVKNGPLDFMPREPFHPLFGAMTQTPVMAELQITQEYLGHSKHLVYLAPMWKEFFDADTFARGPGSTVARAIDGSLHPYRITGIAGVANTGSDANWTGHDFAQANWYAFGRLAWDPSLSPEQIADEWLAMTFSSDAAARQTLREMMMASWETLISYSMPLGLHHLIAGDHYAPAPWNATEPRDDWTAVYYHHADEQGVGFDRTRRGSRAVEQYFPPLRDQLDDLATCPEKLLLWFHHVPWTHRMRNGRTLWDELCFTYSEGVRRAEAMQTTWQSLAPQIDPQRHQAITHRLQTQVTDARQWRDACLRYFQQFSKQPIPSTPHNETAPQERGVGRE